MKTRQGFVSNSSTTSFAIYGTWVRPINDEAKDEDEFDDEVYNLIDSFPLASHSDYDGEAYILGGSFGNIGDNETKTEFKERVEQTVRDFIIEHKDKLALVNDKFMYETGAWRDG